MNITWKRNEAKYSTGDVCMVGRVKVGAVFQPTVSKGETPPWRCSIELPGISMKRDTIDHPTIEQAKARLERAVRTWFDWTKE